MKKDVILSHDLGTTGDKASLYERDGTLLATIYSPYKTYYPQPDWVQQDPGDWWKAVCESTRDVIEKAGISKESIAGVSFSGQMMSLIPVGRDGRVLMDQVMIWADCRSKEEAALIEDRIDWKRFYQTTGAGMAIPLYALAKTLWIKRNLPHVYKEAFKFLGVKDVIIQKLTGNYSTDFSDASNTGLLNLASRSWGPELLAAAEIDIEKLPERILKSTDIAGAITAEAAHITGLLEGTPVIVGGGDVPCAALGAGVIAEGQAYNYMGSASWFAIAAHNPIFDEMMRPFTLCHVVPDTYVVQLAMFSAGVVHEWVKNQFCEVETRDSKALGTNVYELLDSKASCSPAGSKGLLFLPNMRPGGAPHNNLDDRGAFVGLTLAHTKEDILRSVMEGISLNIKIMCEAMEKQAGTKFDTITFIGGGAKSEIWRRIQASVMNRKIRTLSAQQEANSLGAAIICGVGLGIFSDFERAVHDFIKSREIIEPSPAEVAVYDELYAVFLDLYQSLSPINSRLKHLAM